MHQILARIVHRVVGAKEGGEAAELAGLILADGLVQLLQQVSQRLAGLGDAAREHGRHRLETILAYQAVRITRVGTVDIKQMEGTGDRFAGLGS